MRSMVQGFGADEVAEAGAPGVIFEALITPHRSLGPRGLRWVGGILLALGAIIAGGVYYLHAWPVLGFTGGEVWLAVWLLMRHAKSRESEMLMLTDSGLRIVRSDGRGRRWEWNLPAAWLRASLEERPGRTPALMLRSRGRSVEVALSLGEDEKRDLLAAVEKALHRQRHPIFDNPHLTEKEISLRPDPST